MHNYLSMVTYLRKLTKYDQAFVQCFKANMEPQLIPRYTDTCYGIFAVFEMETYRHTACTLHKLSVSIIPCPRTQHVTNTLNVRCHWLDFSASYLARTQPRGILICGGSIICRHVRVLKAGRLSLTLRPIISCRDIILRERSRHPTEDGKR